MIDIEKIGRNGEILVAHYFKNKGHSVEISKDKFDMEKDLTIDGSYTEVKTQTVYRKFPTVSGPKPAFTVDIAADRSKVFSNQLNKCANVERLVFVSRPTIYDKTVRIYEAPPIGKRRFTIIQNSRDKRYVAGFLISDMSEITSFSDKTILEKFEDSWR